MTDEQPKGDAVPQEAPKVEAPAETKDFIFDLADQPTIKVKLKTGDIKEFAADLVMLEMLQAGIGTKEMENSPETVQTVCKIVSTHVGEPVGPGMASAIIGRMTALLSEYRKKASATLDSDTTSGSGAPNTSEPAP